MARSALHSCEATLSCWWRLGIQDLGRGSSHTCLIFVRKPPGPSVFGFGIWVSGSGVQFVVEARRRGFRFQLLGFGFRVSGFWFLVSGDGFLADVVSQRRTSWAPARSQGQKLALTVLHVPCSRARRLPQRQGRHSNILDSAEARVAGGLLGPSGSSRTNTGGHRSWFCRKAMIPFGPYQAPLYRGSRRAGETGYEPFEGLIIRCKVEGFLNCCTCKTAPSRAAASLGRANSAHVRQPRPTRHIYSVGLSNSAHIFGKLGTYIFGWSHLEGFLRRDRRGRRTPSGTYIRLVWQIRHIYSANSAHIFGKFGTYIRQTRHTYSANSAHIFTWRGFLNGSDVGDLSDDHSLRT